MSFRPPPQQQHCVNGQTFWFFDRSLGQPCARGDTENTHLSRHIEMPCINSNCIDRIVLFCFVGSFVVVGNYTGQNFQTAAQTTCREIQERKIEEKKYVFQ